MTDRRRERTGAPMATAIEGVRVTPSDGRGGDRCHKDGGGGVVDHR